MHSNKQLSEKPYCDRIYFSREMWEIVMNVSLKLSLVINVYPGLTKYMFLALQHSAPANNFAKLSLIRHKWLRSATEALSQSIY